MSDGTGIEWTDATWNAVIGCDKVSAGCDNCYAIRTAHRFQAHPNPKVSAAYAGTEADGDWTGQINMLEDRLDIPMRWTRPRRIFVNAQSDLFHKNVSVEFIAKVFTVMALTPQHTYQILTKRHGRMRSLLNSEDFQLWVGDMIRARWDRDPRLRERTGWMWDVAGRLPKWPLPNVHLGVSVEDESTARLRVPALLRTPAAVRWLSMEPLLGPVHLDMIVLPERDRDTDPDLYDPSTENYPGTYNALSDEWWPAEGNYSREYDNRQTSRFGATLDWVVAGGESGPGARPMHPDWVRSIRDQCAAYGVPFLFKQWGDWVPTGERWQDREETDTEVTLTGATYPLAQPGHWSSDTDATVRRVGKKKAGRELDGRTHDEYPQETHA